MNKITKSFLMLLLLVAGAVSAQAQDDWFNDELYRFRQEKKSEGAEGYDPILSNKSKVALSVDPADETNQCIKVVAAQNGTATTSQFWIRGAEVGGAGFAEGQGFRIRVRVKADSPCEVVASAHQNWGYLAPGNGIFGKVKVTEDWTTVSLPCVATSSIKNFTDLCLDLSNSDAQRTFYFDDIQITRGSEWFVTNQFRTKDYHDREASYSNDATGNNDNFPVPVYVSEDDCVEVVATPQGTRNNGTWDAQLFIKIPDEYVGKSTKLTMKVKATEAVNSAALSYHATASGAGWGASPKPQGDVSFTVSDWTDVTVLMDTKGVTAKGELAAAQQVDNFVIDLSYGKAEGESDGYITYWFKDVKFEPAQEDWYLSNNITVAGADAPYVYGTGDEGGYVEVDGGNALSIEIPESFRGSEVEIFMTVKASAETTVDGIEFATAWAQTSKVFDATEATAYELALPEGTTFDFDEISFKKYFAPVEYGDLVEIPVDGTLVKEIDFTTATSFTPSWGADAAGYTRELEVGTGLVIVNDRKMGMWDPQFFIMEGFDLYADKDYAVRYTLKYQGDGGTMQINMGSWGTNTQNTQVLNAGPIYTHMVQEFPGWSADASGAHVMFQSGDIAGRMIVEKVEVFDITPDYASMTYTDLINEDFEGEEVNAGLIAKLVTGHTERVPVDPNDPEGDTKNVTVLDDVDPELLPVVKSEVKANWKTDADEVELGSSALSLSVKPQVQDEAGEYKGTEYDSQFFIRLPKALPKNAIINVEFDYWASKVASVNTQAHNDPGQYVGNSALGAINFAEKQWQHFQKYVKVGQDMRTIAFNMTKEATGATYRFDNFKIQIADDFVDAAEELTATVDAKSLWVANALPLNTAINDAKQVETEGKGYTEESVQALEDAIAAGKAELTAYNTKNSETGEWGATSESLAQAEADVKAAVNGLKGWFESNQFRAKDYHDREASYSNDATGNNDNFPVPVYVSEDDCVEVVATPQGTRNNGTWDAQLFIKIPDEYVGKSTKLTMKVKATEAVNSAALSYHATASGAGWGASPKPQGDVSFTVSDWTDVTVLMDTKGVTAKGELAAAQQVDNFVIDLSYGKAEGESDGYITYWFKDVKFEPAQEDWYLSNNITVAGADAPYVYGTGDEGGYVEVDGGNALSIEIPESFRGSEVEIFMTVKASAETTVDGIEFATAWAQTSKVFDATEATAYELALPEGTTFDFDEISFKKYFAPVEYGDLVEIPVDGTLVKEIDFTTATSFTPSWGADAAGYTRELEVGTGLVIVNDRKMGMWDPQFFIMEGFDLYADKDYAVRYTLKYQGDGGTMQINMGSWGTNTQNTQVLNAGPIYTHMVQEFPGWSADASGAHVMFQSGDIAGRMIVEKVEVFDITPDYASMTYTDLINEDFEGEEVNAGLIAKLVTGHTERVPVDPNDPEGDTKNVTVLDDVDPELLPVVKSEVKANWKTDADEVELGSSALSLSVKPQVQDEAGEYKGTEYDSQFFIRLPKALPKNAIINVEFDYWASKVASVNTQAHNDPGQYVGNSALGAINFAEKQWQHFQKYVKVGQDMRTIAFNMTKEATGATYRFDNFKIQIADDFVDAAEELTATVDAKSLWVANALPLNTAINDAKQVETEGKGYTEASVKALEDAIAAGKAELTAYNTKDSETGEWGATSESLAQAKADVEAAVNGLKVGYDVVIAEGIKNGTVEADVKSAAAGDIVTLTATPNDESCESIAFTVTDANGDPVEVDQDAGTFVMPASSVTVSATFTYPTVIEGVDADAALKDGKYFINGQIVIVKDGKKYNAAGVEIE